MSIIAEIQSKGLDKLAEDFKKSAQAGKELNSELQTASSNTNSLTDNLNKMKQQLAGLQTGSKEFKELEGEIKAAEAAMNSMSKNSETLKREYRELIKEVGLFDKALNDLERTGNKNTQVYRDLKQAQQELKAKAGELKDQIGDLQAEISTLGSDTRGLDLTLRGLTALSGGFQAVQGASVLFGKENKKLEETLVKLNAVMSITQGLQVIQEELSKKDSLITLALGRAKQFLALAIGEGSTAMKIFRGALLATGIGAAIVGIIALYENWDKLTDAIGLGNEALREKARLDKLDADARKEAQESIKGEVSKLYELIAVAKNENLSKKERNEAIKQINKNFPEYLGNINLENINTEKTNDLIKKQIKLLSLRAEVKKLIDKRSDLSLKLDDNDALLKEASGLSKAWAAVQVAFNGFGGASNTISNAVDNVKGDISQQITDIDKLIQNKLSQIGSNGYDNSGSNIIKNVKNGMQNELKGVSFEAPEILFKIAEDPLKDVISELKVQLEEANKGLIDAFSRGDTQAYEGYVARINDITKALDILEKKLQFIKSGGKIDILADVKVPEDVNIFNEVDFNPNEVAKTKFQQAMGRLFNIKSYGKGFGLEVSNQFIDLFSGVESNLFGIIKSASDARLAILEDEKNRGVISEKKYQEEVKKEKIKQAKIAKAEAVFNIGINIAQAITKAIAQGGIAGIAIGAIMSAIGLAQLAIVASKPLPAFKKGVIDLPLGNNPKGDDTIPAMLHEGESVMTAEETKKHKSLFKAIRGNKYDDWVNEEFYKMIKEVGVRPNIFDIKLPQFGGTSKVKSKDVVVNVNNDKIVEELYWIRHAVDKMDRNNLSALETLKKTNDGYV